MVYSNKGLSLTNVTCELGDGRGSVLYVAASFWDPRKGFHE